MIFTPFAFRKPQIQEITPVLPVSTDRVLYYDAGNVSSYPGTGTSWSNLDATSLTSTLTNGAFYSSTNGGRINFDGTNDYTTGADNAIIDFGTGAFTIEIWVVITGDSNLNASNQRSAGLVTAINKSGTLNGWNLTTRGSSTTTGTSIVFEVQVSGTGQYPDYTFPSTLSKNTLYQLGVSHSSANGTKFIYNGTNNSASSNISQAVNGNFALEIGRLGIPNYLHYLNGAVAILRIYKGRQLSDAEVLQNYNADSSRI